MQPEPSSPSSWESFGGGSRKLRRLTSENVSRTPNPESPLTEPDLGLRLRRPLLRPISSTQPLQNRSRLRPLSERGRRYLDFDLEAVAAGYADPNWVPHTVTAWAYCWYGTDDVHVQTLPVESFYSVPDRQRFLQPLLAVLEAADVLCGHNLLRFDLPVLQAEVMRLGLPSLLACTVEDTIRLPRSKGFKKGQDNLGVLLDVPLEKLPLNYQQWQNAYAEPDLATVKERVVGDVRQHMLIREQMRQRGWLKPPRVWKP